MLPRFVLFAGLCAGLLFTSMTRAQVPASPAVYGVVTDAGTPERFRVEGEEVVCTPATMTETQIGAGMREGHAGCEQFRLGQTVGVYGKRNKALHAIEATRTETERPRMRKLEGYAVVDRQPTQSGSAWSVNADGYRLLVDEKTHAQFAPPMQAMRDVGANTWVRYSGRQQPDGSVALETVDFSPNFVNEREDKLREKAEFDPATVTESDRQSGLSKAFRGFDPKRFPAYNDAAMQGRISSIGQRLVPAYQAALPENNPTRINFRFQVIDQQKMRDALTLPNGIILVPHQVIERLANDDQVAAVLADNVAAALEKQSFRLIPTAQGMTAAEAAGAVGGAFVPGLGLATLVAGGAAGEKMLRRAEEQSGRVSLELMHDAGFDMAEAPMAWWLLASGKPKPITEIALPYRAAYLYQEIYTSWPASASLSTQQAVGLPAALAVAPVPVAPVPVATGKNR